MRNRLGQNKYEAHISAYCIVLRSFIAFIETIVESR